jgi:hypothetical protein
MRLIVAAALVVHGLIHLIGVAKAFRRADLPQWTQPISPLTGWLWLAAALLPSVDARSAQSVSRER